MNKRKLAYLLIIVLVTINNPKSVNATTKDDLTSAINSGQASVLNYDNEGTPNFLVGDIFSKEVKTKEEAENYINNNLADLNIGIGKFKVKDVEKDQLGYSHYRLSYFVSDIEVFGGEIILHTDKENKIYAINGDVKENVPTKDFKEDFKIAEEIAYNKGITFEKISNNDVLDKSIKKNIMKIDGEYKAVYNMSINTINCSYDIIVNSIDSEVIKSNKANNLTSTKVSGVGQDNKNKVVNGELYNGIYYLRDLTRKGSIEVLNSEKYSSELEIAKVKDFRQESYKSTSPIFNDKEVAPVIDIMDNLGKTYDYFLENYSWDSYDNKGSSIVAVVNYDFGGMNAVSMSPGIFAFCKPGDNDYFGGKYNSSALALDIVAHEFTHGIIGETCQLINNDESYAMSESLADVFGVLAEGKEEFWILGEDAYYNDKYLRNMKEPSKSAIPQPDNMKDFIVNGNPHDNAGILNKAFYNVVSEIGKDKAGKIYFRAMTNYLNPTSGFLDFKLALEMSAIDLYSEYEKKVIGKSFEDVGIKADEYIRTPIGLGSPIFSSNSVDVEGDFTIDVGIAKGTTAKRCIILDQIKGEILLDEKITSTEEYQQISAQVKGRENGIYYFVVYLVEDENAGILDIIQGKVLSSAKMLIVRVGEKLSQENVNTYNNWEIGKDYEMGDIIIDRSKKYACWQSHKSQEGWEPGKVPSIWVQLN